MQSEGVVVAIISTIVTTVVATSIVVAFVAIVAVAVGAFGSPFLGLLIPIVMISSSGYDRRSSRYPNNP
jgi:ABC-type enterochelin transport system permease subunit